MFKKMIFSLGYTYESNPIAEFQTEVNVSSNKQYITSKNLESMQTIFASFSQPWTITDWWTSQVNVNSVWQKIRADYNKKPLSISNINYNISASQSLTFPKNIVVEISGFYQSKALMGTSVTKPFGQLNAGIQKSSPRKTAV